MEQENWKLIPNHVRYEVSDLGRVRTWQAKGGRLLNEPEIKKIKIDRRRKGSPRRKVKLWSHGKSKMFKVAQLVLLAFVGPRPGPEYETSHLDGGSLDDRLVNLLWETGEQNRAREIRSGRSRCKRPKALARWFSELPIETQMQFVVEKNIPQKFYHDRAKRNRRQGRLRANWRQIGLCPGCGGEREDARWKRCARCRERGRSRYIPKLLQSVLDLSVQRT